MSDNGAQPDAIVWDDAELDPDDDVTYEEVPTLAERLRRIMVSIGGITKEGEYNAAGVHYNFRGIEQIAPRVRDAMIEHGVVCMPVRMDLQLDPRDPVQRDGKPPSITVMSKVCCTYRFINVDEPLDWLEAQVVASATDSGDKYVTKALTSAWKYLLLQTFSIADPSDDQDRYNGDESGATLTEADVAELRVEWPATDTDVDALRVAAGMLSDTSKTAFATWWKNTGNVGSLKDGRVNARYLPAAMAMVQVLLDSEGAAAERDADATRT